MQIILVFFIFLIAFVAGYLTSGSSYEENEFVEKIKSSPNARLQLEEGLRTVVKQEKNTIKKVNQISEMESRYRNNPIKLQIMQNLNTTEESPHDDQALRELLINQPEVILENLHDLLLDDDQVTEEQEIYLLSALMMVQGHIEIKLNTLEKYLTKKADGNNEATITAVAALAEIRRSHPSEANRIFELLNTLDNPTLKKQFDRFGESYEQP